MITSTGFTPLRNLRVDVSETGGAQSGAAADSSLLGSDTVSLFLKI